MSMLAKKVASIKPNSGDDEAQVAKTELVQANALLTMQRFARERHLKMADPSIKVARAYADSFMPHASDGRLYRTIGLTEPCRRWRADAPVRLAVFDGMGVNIGLYMRFVYGSIATMVMTSIVALVPIGYNFSGTYIEDNWLLVGSSLGNAPTLSPLHGISDLVIVLLLGSALMYGAHMLRPELVEYCNSHSYWVEIRSRWK